MAQQPDEFFTLRSASEDYFSGAVSLETVRDWVHAGRLPFVRPGRMILIRRSDLDNLVNGSADARLAVPGLERSRQRKRETVSV